MRATRARHSSAFNVRPRLSGSELAQPTRMLGADRALVDPHRPRSVAHEQQRLPASRCCGVGLERAFLDHAVRWPFAFDHLDDSIAARVGSRDCQHRLSQKRELLRRRRAGTRRCTADKRLPPRSRKRSSAAVSHRIIDSTPARSDAQRSGFSSLTAGMIS